MDGLRLAHLHDGRLGEVERDHVTTHAAHHDAVADVERLTAQDDDVARQCRDDLLHRERQADADEAEGGG